MATGMHRVLAVLGMLALALLPAPAAQAAGNQGLQGGWAVDNQGRTDFYHSLVNQYGSMQSAGAGWVRINFRLGDCFQDWKRRGCNGKSALQTYDVVVNRARDSGLQVMGLISAESWKGNQSQWTANNAETTNGSGDNRYTKAFAESAAGVLAAHFGSRVAQWQIWNEPNAWTATTASGQPTGGSFIYPSNFAWLLKRSYAAIKANSGAAVVSGGIFGHDGAGLTMTVLDEQGRGRRVTKRGTLRGTAVERRPDRGQGPPSSDTTASTACPDGVLASGADYLCSTYEMGLSKAGWSTPYPFDQIGQHQYLNQGGDASASNLTAHLEELRQAYTFFETTGTSKKTCITEVGWTTSSISQST